MILLSTAGENAVQINPIFRFFLYFIMCVPMTVALCTIFLKFISIFILPWKVCLYIGIALGIIVTIFLLVITIGIEMT
ncbi:TPA: hypothetical protein SLA02_002787 [Staphylococcus aureus]|nr:hypothetical protein [Staphylococcus aureus]